MVVMLEGPASTTFAPCVDGDTYRGRRPACAAGMDIPNESQAFGIAACAEGVTASCDRGTIPPGAEQAAINNAAHKT